MNGREWLILLISFILIMSIPLTLWWTIRTETVATNILLSGDDWDIAADVDGLFIIDQAETDETTLVSDDIIYITWPGDASVTYISWKFTNYTNEDLVADEIQSINISVYMGGDLINASDVHEAWLGGGGLSVKDITLTASDNGDNVLYLSSDINIVDRIGISDGYIAVSVQFNPVKENLQDADVWESGFNMTGPTPDTIWSPTNRITMSWFGLGFAGTFIAMLATKGLDIPDIRKALTGGWQQ